jgi:ribosomal protein S18 acetylase RimI-like enzyme
MRRRNEGLAGRRICELTLRGYAEYAAVMEPSAWAGLDGALRATLAGDDPAERLVAEMGGKMVGAVRLYPPAMVAYGGMIEAARWPELRLLAVAPEARGHGVGRALVDECVRRARRMGATDLGLHSSHSMRAAIEMYERMGFVRAPEHDFHPEGSAATASRSATLRNRLRNGGRRIVRICSSNERSAGPILDSARMEHYC